MKSFIYLFVSLACLLFFTACDSHSWEDTYDADGSLVPGSKRLFEAHGYHDSHEKSHDSHEKSHDSHKEHTDHDDHHAKEGH